MFIIVSKLPEKENKLALGCFVTSTLQKALQHHFFVE